MARLAAWIFSAAWQSGPYAELLPDDQAEFDKVLVVLESSPPARRLTTNHTSKN